MLWRRNYNVTLATKTTTLQRRHDVACLLGLSKMLHSPSLFVLDSADLMLSKKRLRSDHWFQSQTDIYWIICVSDSTYFHSRIRSIVLTTWYPKYAHLSQNSLLFVAFGILNFGKIDRSTNSFQNWITARFAYIDYFQSRQVYSLPECITNCSIVINKVRNISLPDLQTSFSGWATSLLFLIQILFSL